MSIVQPTPARVENSKGTDYDKCVTFEIKILTKILSKLMSIVQPTPARVENSKGTDYDKCVTFEIKILTK